MCLILLMIYCDLKEEGLPSASGSKTSGLVCIFFRSREMQRRIRLL